MKSTREKILHTLLVHPRSTINDLAKAVGINGISIRHHLSSLEADNLITSAEERHGVGRPRLIYSLTDKGVEEFPTSYLHFTRLLLSSLKERMTEEEFSQVFSQIGSELAADLRPRSKNIPLDEQIKQLDKMMQQQGYIVEWHENQDVYRLEILSCPYNKLSAEFPEMCAMDASIVSGFLTTPIEVESSIHSKAKKCAYIIPKKQKKA